MAKKPQGKAITQDPYIFRQPFQWTAYRGPGTAETWRTLAANQPIAELCKQKLSLHAQATEWSIEAKEAKEADEYKEDIEYYTKLLDHPAMPFDEWIDLMINDMLDLPQGATSELVRWKPGKGPLKHGHENGHVHEIHFVDGATVRPTGDREIPVVQQVSNHVVYFEQLEVARMLHGRRPELKLQGYSRPPLEKAYLAIQMLYYGDAYYAKYLMDTPEAGILYLGDMDQESATEWLDGFRALFGGASPFKVPVIAGTEKPPQWTPFSLDPSKIAYDQTIERYGKIVAASYGLKMSDLGLDGGQETLAGKIRDERAFMGTGMGAILIKIENMINSRILPDYLVFRFKVHSEETIIQKMRARLMAGQAAKVLEEAQIATAAELQQQFKLEGLLTVPLEAPSGNPPPTEPLAEHDLPTEARQNPTNGQVRNEMERVPVAEGGEGDIRDERPRKLKESKSLVEMSQRRWPSGTEGGQGGRFAPVEGSDISAMFEVVGGDFSMSRRYEQKTVNILDLSRRAGVSEEDVETVLMAWTDSQADNPTNMQVQAIASRLFDAPLSQYQLDLMNDYDREMKAGRAASPPLSRKTVEAVLKATYKATQERIEEEGTKMIQVYRGVELPEPIGEMGGSELVRQNALSSWSAKRQVAEEFASESAGGYSAVMSMNVPSERVISTALTGFGSLPEYEVVIAAEPDGLSTVRVEQVQQRTELIGI